MSVENSLRIVSWNCCGSPSVRTLESARKQFREKLEAVATLDPDILILQEAPKEDALKVLGYTLLWSGSSLGRGICIGVSQRIDSLRFVRETRSSLTVQCGDFYVVGVWSKPEGNSSFQKYVDEVAEVIEANRDLLQSGSAIVVGDFNSNVQWDQSTRRRSHSDNVRSLGSFGLSSAYHTFHGCEQGEEPEATFVMHRNLEKGFHIDYCFLPAGWEAWTVEIGRFDDWVSRSDHCPVIVDLGSALEEKASGNADQRMEMSP